MFPSHHKFQYLDVFGPFESPRLWNLLTCSARTFFATQRITHQTKSCRLGQSYSFYSFRGGLTSARQLKSFVTSHMEERNHYSFLLWCKEVLHFMMNTIITHGLKWWSTMKPWGRPINGSPHAMPSQSWDSTSQDLNFWPISPIKQVLRKNRPVSKFGQNSSSTTYFEFWEASGFLNMFNDTFQYISI